jgi:parvulin-like peptidyl-prolyl isomerase
MTPRALAATACLLLAAAPGCRLPRETAAVVNGRPIPAADLEAEVRLFTTPFGQLPPALESTLPKVRRGILDRLIDRELMLEEAERRGIRPGADEIDRAVARAAEGLPAKELDASLAETGMDRAAWRRRVAGDLVVERLQKDVAARVEVGEPEVAAWQARHRDRRDLPEEVRASQILVRSEEEAAAARREILAGASFGDVARRVSLSPDADRGGDLGYFARGQMPPEFDEAVFALTPGRLSEVVETAYGYHLFLVTDRRAARTRTEAEVRAEVRAALLAEKRESAFRAWLAGARREAKIRVNSALAPAAP